MTDALPAASADGRVEFRPSWQSFHRRMLMRMLFLAPLLVVFVLIGSWPSIGLGVVMIGAAVTLSGVALAIYFGRSRVLLTGGTIQVRGPLRTRGWPLGELAVVVLVPTAVAPPGPDDARPATLYAVSRLHERLFSLSGDVWDRAELERVAEATGVETMHAPIGLTAAQLRERFPGTVGWTALHPWLFALLIMAVSVVVMFAVVVVATIVLVSSGQLPMPSAN